MRIGLDGLKCSKLVVTNLGDKELVEVYTSKETTGSNGWSIWYETVTVGPV